MCHKRFYLVTTCSKGIEQFSESSICLTPQWRGGVAWRKTTHIALWRWCYLCYWRIKCTCLHTRTHTGTLFSHWGVGVCVSFNVIAVYKCMQCGRQYRGKCEEGGGPPCSRHVYAQGAMVSCTQKRAWFHFFTSDKQPLNQMPRPTQGHSI